MNNYCKYYYCSWQFSGQEKASPGRGGGGGGEAFFPWSRLLNKSLLVMYKEACKIGTCNFFRQVTCIFEIVE